MAEILKGSFVAAAGEAPHRSDASDPSPLGAFGAPTFGRQALWWPTGEVVPTRLDFK